jgi:hypothetical protein
VRGRGCSSRRRRPSCGRSPEALGTPADASALDELARPSAAVGHARGRAGARSLAAGGLLPLRSRTDAYAGRSRRPGGGRPRSRPSARARRRRAARAACSRRAPRGSPCAPRPRRCPPGTGRAWRSRECGGAPSRRCARAPCGGGAGRSGDRGRSGGRARRERTRRDPGGHDARRRAGPAAAREVGHRICPPLVCRQAIPFGVPANVRAPQRPSYGVVS